MRPGPQWPIAEDEYVNLYKSFNPVQYDPDAWVELAKAAGQRYIVFLTKHHDGFCMFDSAFTDYKITSTPYEKDVIGHAGATPAQGTNMPLGFYYSPPDMHHPGYRDTSKPASDNWHGEPRAPEWPLYLEYMDSDPRVADRYGPVAVVWFDGLIIRRSTTGDDLCG